MALADPRMLEAPFCYLAGHTLVEFNGAERQNFVRYVRNGGFVFVDDCNHDIDGLLATSFEAQMVACSARRHCRSCPTATRCTAASSASRRPARHQFRTQRLGRRPGARLPEGIEVDGRLGLLYSNKDYGCEWDYDWRNKRFLAEDNTRFGVNIVMYALNN